MPGLDQLIFDSTGMLEGDQLLAKAFSRAHLESLLLKIPKPECRRAFRNRQADRADLAGALAGLASGMLHREAGDQPAHIPGVVPVVQMQDRLLTVVQGGLLDALQTEDF